MRHGRTLTMLWVACLALPTLMFWKRGGDDKERDEVFDQLYATLAAVFEAVANLKPDWTETWANRAQHDLPPKYAQDEMLPRRTLDAVREQRFGRALLQRHRWRSVQQPLFEEIDPTAWAALQRRLQLVCADLLAVQDSYVEGLRRDETEWIAHAVEGFDNARAYLRTAEREGEPPERQVANSAYVALHLTLQLSGRLIDRQRFELSSSD